MQVNKAWHQSDVADFCIALGSSLTVTPACEYAGWVGEKAADSHLVVVNLQRTPYDSVASVRVNGYCDDFMERLMRELGLEL